MHKLLQRQLKKALRRSGNDVPDMDYLLELVSASYEEADQERRLTSHAADLMEQEMMALNEKTIRQARQHFETVLNQLGEGVLFLNRQNQIIGLNQIAEQLLGQPLSSLQGQSVFALFNPFPHWDADTQESQATESQLAHSGLPVELVRGDLRNAGRQEWLLIFRDISERYHAKERLKASEQMFRDFAEASSDWFWETDEKHRIIRLSGFSPRAAHIQPDELLGRSRMELMKHAPKEVFEQHIQDLNAHRPFRDLEYELEMPEGSSLVSINGKPIFDAEGQFIGYRGCARDITAQRETDRSLQKVESQLRTAISSTNEGIALFDANDQLILFNDRAKALYSRIDDVIQLGCHYNDMAYALIERGAFKLDMDGQRWLEHQTNRETRFSTKYNIVRTHDDRYIRAMEYPTPEGGTVGIYSDVTDTIQLENNLRAEKEKAEQASRAKSEFLANMSHEIRTPMNAIIGLSHLALQDPQLSADQREYLDKIHHSSNHLLGLLNDILDFSKIEAGKLALHQHSFDFNQLVQQISTFVQPACKEKLLDFYWDIGPDIPKRLGGDLLRLGQVLTNLAGNAVKFTHQGSVTIRIRALSQHALTLYKETETDHNTLAREEQQHISASQHNGSETNDLGQILLKIEVIDTGIGIDPEQQQQLFAPFTQADSSITRHYGGTGLGLAISRQLIELMGGQLKLQSRQDRGSCFSFSLPLTIKSRHSFCHYPALENVRLLQLEQNPLAQAGLEKLLRHYQGSLHTIDSLNYTPGSPSPEQDYLLVNWEQLSSTDLHHLKQCLEQWQLPTLIYSYQNKTTIQAQLPANAPIKVLNKPLTPVELCTQLTSTAEPDKAKAGSCPPQADDTQQNCRILLVEDNSINQMVAGRFLQKIGMPFDLAENGQQAIEQLQQRHYDVVLMDLQMPIMDGLTATRQIRQQAQWQQLPIIAMTANAMQGDQERCLESGMSDYIAKPIDFGELQHKLELWLPKPDV